jgi:hypothetical protein
MPRQPRNILPDGVFHVTARAVYDLSLFEDDADRQGMSWPWIWFDDGGVAASQGLGTG